MDVTYITSAQKASQLPTPSLPEVAIIGRSNCGKSSLINALTDHRNLARASSTPGRTQMANFFLLNRRLILVDLPGYGFNVARKEIRDLWDELLAVYTERTSIRKFLFLMDCRRDFEDFELEFIENLGRNAPVAIVLTKLDKLKKSEIKPRIAEISGQLRGGSAQCTVFPISSMKKQGIAELREHIFQFMAPTPS